MNAARCKWLRAREASMYRLGYPYAAWIVHQDMLGLFPVCSLEYFREEPTPDALKEMHGDGFMHACTATPECPPERAAAQ